MQKISKMVALLNGQDLTPRNPLEKAVKTLVASIGKGGNAPLEVTVTTSKSGGKTVVTYNKTADEVFAAVAAGRPVIATTADLVSETMVTITYVVPVEAFRFEAEGDTSYVFKSRCDIGSADKLFYGSDFAADDTVVLTEV